MGKETYGKGLVASFAKDVGAGESTVWEYAATYRTYERFSDMSENLSFGVYWEASRAEDSANVGQMSFCVYLEASYAEDSPTRWRMSFGIYREAMVAEDPATILQVAANENLTVAQVRRPE